MKPGGMIQIAKYFLGINLMSGNIVGLKLRLAQWSLVREVSVNFLTLKANF